MASPMITGDPVMGGGRGTDLEEFVAKAGSKHGQPDALSQLDFLHAGYVLRHQLSQV